ncbi:MAG TPA: TPM domain-containing protein [Spirochaetota bacterium]|nr:TPM domain-containing protein [Spirochaetota bacterium]
MRIGIVRALPLVLIGALAALSPLAAEGIDERSVRLGETIPAITRPVNDYQNIIPPDAEKRISELILAHRERTGVQLAVLTVCSTGGLNIEEFSMRTAEKWGGGSKERDDGILFTVASCSRRMRIEVGYGLEGYLTDLRAGRILDGIRGDFRKNDYAGGIEKAVRRIIDATDSLRPGQEISLASRFWRAFSRLPRFYVLFFLFGALAAVLFVLAAWRDMMNVWLGIATGLFLFIAVPILLQLYFHGAKYWTPWIYLSGAFAAVCLLAGIMAPKKRKQKIVATAFAAVPALVTLVSIVYFIQVRKPSVDESVVSPNESFLIGILVIMNIVQFIILAVTMEILEGGGSSYSSGGSGSSDSYSGSSSSDSSYSSSDSSYSGGGGSFGGGGASSSW